MPKFQVEWASRGPAIDKEISKQVGFCSAAWMRHYGIDKPLLGSLSPTLGEHLEKLRGPEGERHVTRSGRIVNRFAPGPGDWDLESLVWAQASLVRYGGESYAPLGSDGKIERHAVISTAEHEYNALKAVDILYPDRSPLERARLKFRAGTHDLVKVRFSDLISTVKAMFPDVKAFEHYLEESFYATFGMEQASPPEIGSIDKRLVVNEGPALFPGTDEAFWTKRTKGCLPIPGIVVPNPAFVVRVPISEAQRSSFPELGAEIELWSFAPFVASALMAELREALAIIEAAA
jgi:hypothetical protein